MRSYGLPRNYCKVSNKYLIRHVLGGQNWRSTPELSWCLHLAAFGDLAKILPWIVLNNCHKRTLCHRGKMPQQFASMLFVSSECVDFERDPLLTFEPATLHSLLWVVSFGRTKSASIDHFLIDISLSFHAIPNNLHHP